MATGHTLLLEFGVCRVDWRVSSLISLGIDEQTDETYDSLILILADERERTTTVSLRSERVPANLPCR